MRTNLLQILVFYFTISILFQQFVLSQPSPLLPLEKNKFETLTSYSEMRTFLTDLVEKNPIIKQKVIGKSVDDREIPALFFSLDEKFGSKRNMKPVVLIFCQQHGGEPSGKEAALMLARDLTGRRKQLLENLDLIVVPQVNPDGGEKKQRRNANEMDLNRNHMILSEPETFALHQLFLEWMPEVTLDVHEYGAVSQTWMSHGFIKNADVQLGKISNVNIDPVIHDFSAAVFVPAVGKQLRENGFTFHEYLVGTPFKDSRLRYSTTAINDGRQSFGIYNTFSFIQEGIQFGNLTDKLEHRTTAQLTALTGFLQVINQHSIGILQIIGESRKTLVSQDHIGNTRAAIQMEYYADSQDTSTVFPVFNLQEWKPKNQELKNFQSTVRVRKSVKKPIAYIIPSSETKLIEILARHRIEMNPLTEKRNIPVEVYEITHLTTMIEEETEVPYVDVEVKKMTRNFDKGTVIVYLTQPAGNFIPLLLEPQSRFSLFQEGSGRKYRLSEYLKENTEFPIYRLIENVELHQIKGKFN
jgi:hypothetical protein